MDLSRAAKPRPRREIVMRVVQPVARRGVALLAQLGIDPLHVVVTHGALGFVAAALIAAGGATAWILAAALLVAKMLLDNMDGGLARATGRVTQAGRYLDTWIDFWNNVAIFAALSLHGPGLWALAAWAALTLVLSIDFNLERLYREARTAGRPRANADVDPDHHVPEGAPPRIFALLKRGYETFFAPQDRAVERLDRATLLRLVGDEHELDDETRRAWNDLFSTAAVVNLGLSTQLVTLALLLVLGVPYVYVVIVLLQAPYLVCVWLLRIMRFRAYLHQR